MGEHTESQESVKKAVMEEDHPFPLTEVDRWVLSQTDEEFHTHDWEELKEIIGELSLSSLLPILVLRKLASLLYVIKTLLLLRII